MRAIRIAVVLRPFCNFFERFAFFCGVLRRNFTKRVLLFVTVLRCFAVFCGVLQMFCERCFVQYSRFFLLFTNAHNTRAYCEFFCVFQCFSMFFGCFVCFVEILQNTRKTPQNTRKTPQNTRKTLQNTTKHIC